MKKILIIVVSLISIVGISFGVYSYMNKSDEDSQSINLPTQENNTNSNVQAESNELRSYSLSQVAVNNNKDSCWLIIDSNVYDVTSYLREHPGGSSEILPVCGKEATNAFNTMNKRNPKSHSPKASEILSKYLIGSISN